MKDLLAAAHEFAFFQAVALLERQRQGPRLGREGPASQEGVRLRPHPSLSFAPADVATIEPLLPSPQSENGEPRYRLTSRFLGLYGASSPLATHYAETIAQSDPDQNRVRDFLDQFHHRLLSLFYRVWARHHYVVEFAPDGTDDLSRRLLELVGSSRQMGQRLGLGPAALLRYAGLLGARPRSRQVLEVLWSQLGGGVAISILPNRPRWIVVPPDQRARLGTQAVRLGQDFVLGEKAFDVGGKFRVCVGPVSYPDFESFLPGGVGLSNLDHIIEGTLPCAFAYEVQLKLQTQSRPPFVVGTSHPARLGWTSWLMQDARSPATDGVSSVVFQARH